MSKQSGALSTIFHGLMVLHVWVLHGQAWAQAGAPVMPSLGQLTHTNPFDAERKLWPDRTPPPPPPPVPAPVTDVDLEIYGVVVAGGAQKALLKLGKRFEGVPVGPTGIAVVPVGGQLGEFVLSQLTTDKILLKAPGGEQWIRFSAKKDRVSGGQAVNQAAASSQSSVPGQGFGGVVAAQPTEAVQSGFPGAGSGVSSPAGNTASAGVPILSVGAGFQGGQPEGASAHPAAQPGSLAAAIFAAQAAQKAAAEGSPPAGAPGLNPFEALFQQQKK